MSTGLVWSAVNLWLSGYLDQSANQLQEALALAQELSHPFTLSMVEANGAYQFLESRQFQSALHHTEAVLSLAQEQGFAYWIAMATMSQGACWSQISRTQEAIANLIHGLATISKMGVIVFRSQHLSWLGWGLLARRTG